jgi:hypothetical protein
MQEEAKNQKKTYRIVDEHFLSKTINFKSSINKEKQNKPKDYSGK